MKTLILPALATVAVGVPSFAADPKPLTESDWARLDREIGDLASSLRQSESQTSVGGLVRAYYASSQDDAFELNPNSTDDFDVNSGTEFGGFLLKDVDLFAEGNITQDYFWRISVDLDDIQNGQAWLEDAYGLFDCGSGIKVLAGNYKAPVLQSNRVAPENQLFPDRTFIGQIFDFWDTGAMATYNLTTDYVGFNAYFGAQNGFDGAADDLAVSGRLEALLNGGTGLVEGALGADSSPAATLGFMWFKDESDAAEGDAWGFDASATMGIFSLHGEVVHFEGELLVDAAGDSQILGGHLLGGNGGSNPRRGGEIMLPINYAEAVGQREDATPWNSTASVLLEALDVEIGVRAEFYDDPGDTSSYTLGANWYRNGHAAIWHAGVTRIDSDAPRRGGITNPVGGGTNDGTSVGIGDATLFQVGLSLGLTTKSI